MIYRTPSPIDSYNNYDEFKIGSLVGIIKLSSQRLHISARYPLCHFVHWLGDRGTIVDEHHDGGWIVEWDWRLAHSCQMFFWELEILKG